ncbi:hypothetical protein [Actinoplanes teichomyceticus]|uniref:Uncharacterized protein n=1 Tax=Actinoplanes teichomyceticus TaxID=1867 RepID=A0A561WAS0_ACTTI|nr:hypothetical protein [Actinoplanes teichomyceticus]TWG20950.1 hypothetical protein FHX34_103479 [Actinoplanes teichomyceticus]GIF16536.1 hypothetical protein Ate01nite_65680 [Actinoplanes teichomyceticus]
MFRTYGKSIIAAIYAVLVVAIPLVTGDNHVDPAEGVTIATAVATAILTYLVPLAPGATWAKTAVGAVLAGLGLLSTLIGDGIDANDLLLIAASVLGALGITLAPAISPATGARAGAAR